MFPFKTTLKIDRNIDQPVFRQISKQLIQIISEGKLQPGYKIPGSRDMSTILEVHRKTVVKAYEELLIQGWLVSKVGNGTYVNENLPILKPVSITATSAELSQNIITQTSLKTWDYYFDDGHPDVRLAPLEELTKEMRRLSKNTSFIKHLDYREEFQGDLYFRKNLANHLNETRGLGINENHILVTRGSIMAMYLVCQNLNRGDIVMMGIPGYQTFIDIVTQANLKLVKLKVDDDGLNVSQLEKHCENGLIPKLVYCVPHHYHPTTVTMSPTRRLELLKLSRKYQFKVLEDDYDYDYHYSSAPILPLKSVESEQVIYVGSFSKTLVPALRLGYIIANPSDIDKFRLTRRYIDRTGDPLLERAMGYLLKEGEIRMTINRNLSIYRNRRDFLVALLKKELCNYIDFKTPQGGMAIWVVSNRLNWDKLEKKCLQSGLKINPPSKYSNDVATRFGFASMTEKELEKAVDILRKEIILLQNLS